MSASTNVTIWCDGNPRTHDGRCHQSDTAPGSWTIKDLRALLTTRGWRCGVRGKDYCPEHARELALRPNVSTLVG